MIKGNNNSEHIEFVSYSGKYPNLCSGILVLKIDGKEVRFGNDKNCDYERFWESGGVYGFTNGYKDSFVNEGEWIVDVHELPDEYQKYANEIDDVINQNVPYGCCGGCL